jgi:hypothetical protein
VCVIATFKFVAGRALYWLFFQSIDTSKD